MELSLKHSGFSTYLNERAEIKTISFATTQNDQYSPLTSLNHDIKTGLDQAVEKIGTYQFLTICYDGIPDPENLLEVYSVMEEENIPQIKRIVRDQVLMRVAQLKNQNKFSDSSLDSEIQEMNIPILRVKIN